MNPVIWCCHNTFERCRFYFQYMQFFELLKTRSTGGALHASSFDYVVSGIDVSFFLGKYLQIKKLLFPIFIVFY